MLAMLMIRQRCKEVIYTHTHTHKEKHTNLYQHTSTYTHIHTHTYTHIETNTPQSMFLHFLIFLKYFDGLEEVIWPESGHFLSFRKQKTQHKNEKRARKQLVMRGLLPCSRGAQMPISPSGGRMRQGAVRHTCVDIRH